MRLELGDLPGRRSPGREIRQTRLARGRVLRSCRADLVDRRRASKCGPVGSTCSRYGCDICGVLWCARGCRSASPATTGADMAGPVTLGQPGIEVAPFPGLGLAARTGLRHTQPVRRIRTARAGCGVHGGLTTRSCPSRIGGLVARPWPRDSIAHQLAPARLISLHGIDTQVDAMARLRRACAAAGYRRRRDDLGAWWVRINAGRTWA